MIILMHLIAVNAVSNPLCAINAANAVYKEEQQPKLNIAFAIAPQGVDDLFCYNTAAIMHICKDYDHFIIFKPYFKPILYGNSLSNITGIGTIILEVNTMVKLQSVKLYNITYVPRFYFNLISTLKLKQLGYYIDGINKHLID
jgi:hypothetical protein